MKFMAWIKTNQPIRFVTKRKFILFSKQKQKPWQKKRTMNIPVGLEWTDTERTISQKLIYEFIWQNSWYEKKITRNENQKKVRALFEVIYWI